MQPVHECPNCTCHTKIAQFIELALIPTPDSYVTTAQAWVRYVEWRNCVNGSSAPYLSQNQFTRQLRAQGIVIFLKGGQGNCLAGYRIIESLLAD